MSMWLNLDTFWFIGWCRSTVFA